LIVFLRSTKEIFILIFVQLTCTSYITFYIDYATSRNNMQCSMQLYESA